MGAAEKGTCCALPTTLGTYPPCSVVVGMGVVPMYLSERLVGPVFVCLSVCLPVRVGVQTKTSDGDNDDDNADRQQQWRRLGGGRVQRSALYVQYIHIQARARARVASQICTTKLPR